MNLSKIETIEIPQDSNTKSEESPKKAKKVKQVSQLVRWAFTLNNYKSEDINEIETIGRKICKKYVFQEETGSNGTPHLQGYFHLKQKMRFSEFGLPKQIHWEKVRNTEATEEYCQKEETRTGKIYKFGFPKEIKIKIIEELRSWQKDIVDYIDKDPDDRKILWVHESIGNVGKSAMTKYLVVKYKALFIDEGKKSDLINLIFNTNMDKCKLVVIDIPRDNNNISYKTMESIKNGLVCNTKYETGVKAFNPPHIIVFANFSPEVEKMSLDRWDIRTIDKEYNLIKDKEFDALVKGNM